MRSTSMCRNEAVGQNSSCQFEHLGKICLVAQFINRRPAHHSFNRYSRTRWWHLQCVTRLERLDPRSNPAQKQIVNVHFFDELVPAHVPDAPKRTRSESYRLQSPVHLTPWIES